MVLVSSNHIRTVVSARKLHIGGLPLEGEPVQHSRQYAQVPVSGIWPQFLASADSLASVVMDISGTQNRLSQSYRLLCVWFCQIAVLQRCSNLNSMQMQTRILFIVFQSVLITENLSRFRIYTRVLAILEQKVSMLSTLFCPSRSRSPTVERHKSAPLRRSCAPRGRTLSGLYQSHVCDTVWSATRGKLTDWWAQETDPDPTS